MKMVITRSGYQEIPGPEFGKEESVDEILISDKSQDTILPASDTLQTELIAESDSTIMLSLHRLKPACSRIRANSCGGIIFW